MGQIFELIADQALEKLDAYYDECHICGARGVDLYSYQGVLTMDEGTTDDDIYVACEKCIRSKQLRHAGEADYNSTIEKYVASLSQIEEKGKLLLVEELIKKNRRTPDIPIFMQRVDRPMCCSDITEFKGYPPNEEELYKTGDQDQYWEEGLKEKSSGYNFRLQGNSESLREVARFTCRHCGKRYFTFQFTCLCSLNITSYIEKISFPGNSIVPELLMKIFSFCIAVPGVPG